MSKYSKTGSIDETDRRILRVLSKEGRLSNTELADRVGLTPSPCWNRVRRLEQEGVISGYGAYINAAALGVPEVVIVEVTLDRHDESVLQKFGQAVAEVPEILEVYLVTGDYDYLLKVAAGNTRDFEAFLRSRLYSIPGIRHSRTAFTLRCLKQVHAYVPPD